MLVAVFGRRLTLGEPQRSGPVSQGLPNCVVTISRCKSVGIRGHRAVLGLGSFSEKVSGDWVLQGPKTVR
eukprot:6988189-Pyramimonas_sp.AAC.1